MKDIKNIIFDFGGVIINVNYTNLITAFKQLKISNFDNLYSQRNQVSLFDEFEKGLISPENFREELRRFLKKNISDQEIDIAWNSMLLDIPKKRLDLLLKIKPFYRTFLLSNTNAIHFQSCLSILKKDHEYNDFSIFFEKTYFSHLLGMRKPDFKVFEFIININQLKPEETLFIDDSIQHIDSAKKTGIHTYLLPAEQDITELFNDGKLLMGF